MKKPNATSVQEYFCQLAKSRENGAFDAVLQGLARCCDADAIGVSGLDTTAASEAASVFCQTPTPPGPFPWHTDIGLLDRLQTAACAAAHHDEAGDWLVSLIWEPVSHEAQLVWAYRAGKRGFSEMDQWSWMFASQALVRWRTQSLGSSALLQRRLELAALVTGRLSHDFGNYLTGILGFTELSLTQVPVDGILHRYLQEVLQSAQHGAEWIRRLHLFCRRQAVQCWPTPLPSILAEEEARLRSAGVFHLRWVAELPADLPLLDIDAGELRVALTELVNNTREACKEPGTIRFSARVTNLAQADCGDLLGSARPGPYVELTMTDDGPGITAEDRAKLCHEIFFSNKPRQRGLGLLVVYGIMQRFQGGLRLPNATGQGAVVQLYLPIAALPGPAPADADSSHVLIVNTNPLVFESMRKVLESRGYRVSVATSAPMALTAFMTPRQSFALVVMDVLLPQLSGFDLARRMLDHDPKARFLFLHSMSSFPGLREEELAKRFPLLRWPLVPQTLLQAVQTALAPTGQKR